MARAGLTKRRLVEAGAELADEIGFEQVTVSVAGATLRRQGAEPVRPRGELRTSCVPGIALLALEEIADRVRPPSPAGPAGRR